MAAHEIALVAEGPALSATKPSGWTSLACFVGTASSRDFECSGARFTRGHPTYALPTTEQAKRS
jgi:hypothetical protein